MTEIWPRNFGVPKHIVRYVRLLQIKDEPIFTLFHTQIGNLLLIGIAASHGQAGGAASQNQSEAQPADRPPAVERSSFGWMLRLGRQH